MKHMKRVFAATAAVLVYSSVIVIAEEPGDARAGHDYARAHCAECHAVEAAADFSPDLSAPPFANVANTPGMTERALAVWLQTSHPTMPNLIIPPADRDNVIAYIMSLKRVSEQ